MRKQRPKATRACSYALHLQPSLCCGLPASFLIICKGSWLGFLFCFCLFFIADICEVKCVWQMKEKRHRRRCLATGISEELSIPGKLQNILGSSLLPSHPAFITSVSSPSPTFTLASQPSRLPGYFLSLQQSALGSPQETVFLKYTIH